MPTTRLNVSRTRATFASGLLLGACCWCFSACPAAQQDESTNATLAMASHSDSAKGGAPLACNTGVRNVDTDQLAIESSSCWPDLSFPGTEWSQQLLVDVDGDVVVSVDNFDWYPFIMVFRDSGSGPDPEACVVANYYSVRFSALAGESYYIVVDQDGTVPTMRFDLNVSCTATENESLCNDGFDNDADWLVDCQDPDCSADSACANGQCEPWDAVQCGDTLVGGSTEGIGTTSIIESYTCYHDRLATSPERAYIFDATTSGWVNFTLSNYSAYPMLFVLEDLGDGCDPNACVAHNYYSVNFYAEAGKRYYLVVDGWGDQTFLFDYSVMCDPPASEQSCSDDIDEDGDGAIDCADDDCSEDPACALGGTCNPVATIDCSTWLLHGDTASGEATNNIGSYACEPEVGLGGPEIAYQLGPFSSNQRLLLTLSNYDTYGLIAVVKDDGSGCEPANCVEEQYWGTVFTARRNTTYYVIVEGDYDQSISFDLSVICDPPVSETGSCSDGVDNDGDFYTDCLDSDCQAECFGDVCNPVQDIDCQTTLMPGSTNSTDATSGIDSYACYPSALMYGNEYAYRFSATSSGWILFTLSDENNYAAIAVVEDNGSCNPANCVGLQYYSAFAYVEAGKTYNVIVDSPDPGSVDYSLSVVCNPTPTEAICGDNIDNDGDFAIDCDDSDCGC